jgi:hypothetical protein
MQLMISTRIEDQFDAKLRSFSVKHRESSVGIRSRQRQTLLNCVNSALNTAVLYRAHTICLDPFKRMATADEGSRRELSMKTKLTAACVILLVLSNRAQAQTGFEGRWSSNLAEVRAALNDARAAVIHSTQVAPYAFASQSLTTIDGAQIDLPFAGNKLSGSITQGGIAMTIVEATIDGKTANLKSKRQTDGGELEQIWTAEMKDNDTIILKVNTVTLAQANPSGSNIIPVTLHRAN